jgi:UDP-N-acetylglucosamine:LPS N-acetylglucosamine transferase
MCEEIRGSVSLYDPSHVLDGVLVGKSRLRVMAIASCGGHWVQLRKLARAFEGHDVSYVTVSGDYRAEVGGARFYSVVDANLSDKLKLVWLAIQMVFVVLRERPDVVISTGAAPGFFGLAWGKLLLGSRTIWVDSIANSERLSASGRYVGRFADLWLTQWKHLRSNDGPHYEGAIL